MMIPHASNPYSDGARTYPNTPTGTPHVPSGLIAALVLLALIGLMWWFSSRGSDR